MSEENTGSNDTNTPIKSPRGDISFPKKEKLTNKKMFEALFAEGRSLSVFPIKLIYLPVDLNNGPKAKVAVVAPKRRFKTAVVRNHIKRLMREAYRLNKPLIFNNIEGNFAFIFLYLGKKAPSFDEVEMAMKKLLDAFVNKDSHEKID